jgi:hypothetical protein
MRGEEFRANSTLSAACCVQRNRGPSWDSREPDGLQVIEFATPEEGLASPVFRTNPGFVRGGVTSGGAPEFVLPNGPIPAGATITVVHDEPRSRRDDTGRWVIQNGRPVADDVCKRIVALTKSHPEKIGPDGSGWNTLYRDPSDGYWELSYPQSELHGGGPPELRCLTSEQARQKYGALRVKS